VSPIILLTRTAKLTNANDDDHPSTNRASKDGVIPLSTPITTTDGKEINEVFVARGTATLISIWACNRNPAVWGPDAKEWKPDRWLKPLPESVVDAHIPGVYSHLCVL
jgi:cytochrome P450